MEKARGKGQTAKDLDTIGAFAFVKVGPVRHERERPENICTEPAWGLVPGAALAPGVESTVLQLSAPPIERAGAGRGGWTEPEEQL